ncbi:hypothetical protein SAMN04489729_6136 [Amycolatopsis lurida]|uniref:Uncharacterized protein n=1 Tax=Amycolatopsis lurida NRRL 2430 TaxID=1460371 RepID=A0A2P2G193_AMYLU|nr:hypothetical protein [Amycolatopsis lurida]KFU82749.1 hypothetical protein BB31_03370 [Amycolatopsis lurida NRRL 2430]SEE04074.1 hypothetical protein SAMN04489729_6136 [Amycolatopsis lurida]
MRWAALYARSRAMPASFAALVVSMAVIWFLARDRWSEIPVSLALLVAIAVTAVGLGGQDIDLDRTAAIRWAPRRVVHLLLIGGLGIGAVLLPRLWEAERVPVEIIVRNASGLLGLAGIAAVLFGGAFGWTLPLAGFAVAFVVSATTSSTESAQLVITWPFQPAGVAEATWTAVVLAVTGLGTYSVYGARR